MPDDTSPLPPGEPLPSLPVPDSRTEIVANTRPLTRPFPTQQRQPAPAKPAENKDSVREVIETIVFVVVLVLLLKTFLAEAFVIPSGSMATTLLGYHRDVTCQRCGFSFLVNASKEADPQEPNLQDVVGCTCPNCEFHNRLKVNGGGLPR